MSDALLVLPYYGFAPLPADLWSRWNFDPVLIGALLAASLYARRLHSRHAGVLVSCSWCSLHRLRIAVVRADKRAVFRKIRASSAHGDFCGAAFGDGDPATIGGTCSGAAFVLQPGPVALALAACLCGDF